MLQLVYMWIEDFRTLKDVNLNFHSNFEFEFKKDDDNENQGILKIRKFNPDNEFIYRYFDNQFISLIVGKNGTGKTSILDIIAGSYKYTYSDKKAFFLLYDFSKKEFRIKNGKFSADNDLDSISLENLSEFYKSGKEINVKIGEGSYADLYIAYASFENLKYDVELSPILPYSTTREIIGNNNLTNKKNFLSLAVQINRALYNIVKGEKFYEEKPDLISNIIFSKVIKWIEHEDTVYFLRNYSIFKGILKNIPDIKFPEKLIIQYIPKDKKIFEENLSTKINELTKKGKNILNTIKEITNFLFNIQNNENLDISIRLKASFVLSLIEEDIFYSSISFINLYLNDLKEILRSDKNEKKKFDDILDKLMETKYYEKTPYKGFGEKLEKFFEILHILNKFDKISPFIGFQKSLRDLDRKSLNQLEKISLFISENFAIVPSFFNLYFYPPLSSGHKNLFKVFSYIEELVNPVLNKSDVGKNIILLLDEPESYLHPELQRLFIYFLTEFLKEKYSDKYSDKDSNKNSHKNFHIIITTHSPFLLSDVPKGNCIFLDSKYNEEKQEYITEAIPKDKLSDNTLAQNIYYLLANGFFMEKGIGEYARRKISEIFNFFYSDKEVDTSYVFKLIDTIGDEVVKNKLKEMFDNIDFYRNIFKKLKEEK